MSNWRGEFLSSEDGKRYNLFNSNDLTQGGPAAIRFSGDIMSIVVTGHEDIEADLSPLADDERAFLMKVAGKLFK